MKQASIGRIVCYVLPESRHRGEIRPAIITRVWNDECVQLTAFPDAVNDGLGHTFPASSAVIDQANKEPGTWHWPEMQPSQ